MMFKWFFALNLLMISTCFAQPLSLNLLQLPKDFQIEVYATVPNVRSMALGSKGEVFVGTFTGNVYVVLPGKDKREVFRLASGLNVPNGVAFYNGSLYVAEINRIWRYDDIENHLKNPLKPILIRSDLPKEKHHGWRYIHIGPDNKLYIAMGVPCNVCLPKDPRLGTISRMDLDGKNFEIYSQGIRNSVGFAWEPTTQKLWFTDNGRDWMGDSLPPDKLNYAPFAGMDFGFPYYDSQNLLNPNYKRRHKTQGITFPALELPAHVAALGITFYQGKMFPEDYRHRVFIAEHGSWNRTKKIGYQVISVHIANGHASDVRPFVKGWLQGETVWGRPVDLLEMKDGSLLISDDYAGVIYRVFVA